MTTRWIALLRGVAPVNRHQERRPAGCLHADGTPPLLVFDGSRVKIVEGAPAPQSPPPPPAFQASPSAEPAARRQTDRPTSLLAGIASGAAAMTARGRT